ncbi:hypothetical protein IPM09_04130 [Candidatus Saccharibacteria bacterium]|nr:MAG: hypothetical protein IPM09_04130 [Candidatus Saccharibacteria bacterium]
MPDRAVAVIALAWMTGAFDNLIISRSIPGRGVKHECNNASCAQVACERRALAGDLGDRRDRREPQSSHGLRMVDVSVGYGCL